MTDKETLEAMFKRVGIGFSVEQEKPNDETPGAVVSIRLDGVGERSAAEWAREGALIGYSSFFSVFFFDAEGQLVNIGTWE